MERNAVLMLNTLLYRLHDAEDFTQTRKNLLRQLRPLVPFSYGSVLLADLNSPAPCFTDPVCLPEEFLPVEENYIRIARKDHTLWAMDSGSSMVLCESRVLSDSQRLSSPIYRECYSRCGVYDTLQLSLVYDHRFLGVVTLYRTQEDGVFADGDIFVMELLSSHLSRLFYQILTGSGEERTHSCVRLLGERFTLTERETEILAHLMEGEPEAEISSGLNIAPSTLKKHMQHIYRKLGISSRWELLRLKR